MEKRNLYTRQARMLKALAHETRQMIVDRRRRRECAVSELQEFVGGVLSTVSKHLAPLRAQGKVGCHREGTTVYYRLLTPCVCNFFTCATQLLKELSWSAVVLGAQERSCGKRREGTRLNQVEWMRGNSMEKNIESPAGRINSTRVRGVACAVTAVLLALQCGVAGLWAQDTVEDLATAYQQAADSSPLIAQARAQLDAELAGKPLARSALLPHLNAGASGGMYTARVTGFGAQTISTGYHADTFSASLTETLYDGQSLIALKQAGSRIAGSEAMLAYAQQLVALDVIEAYFGVLEAEANERVARHQVDLLKNISEQANASLKVGSGDIITVEEAQAQLDAANADLISAQNAVAIARSQLERLTHHPAGSLQDIQTLEATGPQPNAVEEWIAAALKNQPLLQEARASHHVAEQQVRYAERARWPTLTLSGVGQHAAGTLVPPVALDQVGAQLNLSIPIYEGGHTRAGIQQSKALERASRAGLVNTEDQIKLETQSAFLELASSVAQYRATAQAVNSAHVSLDGTRKGYEIGSRSIIDLLTATTNYALAERAYSQALYAHLTARARLKAAAGVLTPTDIEKLNSLLNGSATH